MPPTRPIQAVSGWGPSRDGRVKPDMAAFGTSVRAPSSRDMDAAQRHQEFMAEIQALRSLIEPRIAVNRAAVERDRAQLAEAQAYKAELEQIYDAIKRTRGEVEALDADAARL